ncbi:uncharacterized protein [Parasteatoda tepidariorum]|uniref:uncharacterized protein isoform X1 n=1 Tax=Parasteatoda tepidariorum TaxID=114398 RepID=UPI0039BC7127
MNLFFTFFCVALYFTISVAVEDVQMKHHRGCSKYVICSQPDSTARKALNECSLSKLTEQETKDFVDHFNNWGMPDFQMTDIDDGLKTLCERNREFQEIAYEEIMHFSIENYARICADLTRVRRCIAHTRMIGCHVKLLDGLHAAGEC